MYTHELKKVYFYFEFYSSSWIDFYWCLLGIHIAFINANVCFRCDYRCSLFRKDWAIFPILRLHYRKKAFLTCAHCVRTIQYYYFMHKPNHQVKLNVSIYNICLLDVLSVLNETSSFTAVYIQSGPSITFLYRFCSSARTHGFFNLSDYPNHRSWFRYRKLL